MKHGTQPLATFRRRDRRVVTSAGVPSLAVHDRPPACLVRLKPDVESSRTGETRRDGWNATSCRFFSWRCGVGTDARDLKEPQQEHRLWGRSVAQIGKANIRQLVRTW
jgi:hypothetical protein